MSLLPQETETPVELVQGSTLFEESAAPAAPAVTEAPAVSGDRTPSEKSLTNHLRSVELPSDREAAEGAESQKVNGEIGNLPASLKDALNLLVETNEHQPKDKFESKVKAAKLEKLSAHVHALSQSTAAPSINVIEFLKRTPDAAALAQIAACYPRQKIKKA